MGGTLREEVLVALGIDNSAVEQGLGVNRNHFKEYLEYLKTDERKYSDWWNTELKKREEMEIASSVRAASRAIQARRLLRERETARELAANAEQAAANTVIGGGSMPAGWAERAAAQKAGRELEMKAAEALKDAAGGAHGTAGAFRELMVVIREGTRGDFKRMFGSMTRLLGMLGFSMTQMAGVAAGVVEAGAIIYYALSTRKAAAQNDQSEKDLDKGAGTIAGRLKTEIANLEKAGKLSHETAKQYDTILNHPTMERNRVIQDRLRALGGPITKHDAEAEARLDEEHRKKLAAYAREDMTTSERLTMDHFKALSLKGEMAKLDRTGLEYKQKQIELDDAQRDILIDQKKLEEEKAQAAQKANEEQRVYDEAKLRMADMQQREREKFMPTLEELAHHGKFGAQARAILRLDRHIKRDYERGDTAGADHDIAARTKAYDSLADRGVLAERAERREVKELTAKMQMHIAAIASGKVVLPVKPVFGK